MSAIAKTHVNQSSVIAISVLFPVLATATVTGRVCARRRNKAGFGVDDYLCFAATIILTACSVDLIIGAAIHTIGYQSPPSNTSFNVPHIVQLEKIRWSYNQLWYLGITLVKLSWLFSYRRIFRGKLFQITNYSAIVLAASWGVCFSLVNFFQCGRHIDLNWDPMPQTYDPQCVDSLAVFFANSLVSCLLDIIILIIPMPAVYQLNLPLRLRLAVMGLFAVGGFCVAASAIRLTLASSWWWPVKTHNAQLQPIGPRGGDVFGVLSLALFWSHMEFGVALVACSLPSLKGVLNESKLLGSIHSTISLASFRGRRGSSSHPILDCSSEEAQTESKPTPQPVLTSAYQNSTGVR